MALACSSFRALATSSLVQAATIVVVVVVAAFVAALRCFEVAAASTQTTCFGLESLNMNVRCSAFTSYAKALL